MKPVKKSVAKKSSARMLEAFAKQLNKQYKASRDQLIWDRARALFARKEEAVQEESEHEEEQEPRSSSPFHGFGDEEVERPVCVMVQEESLPTSVEAPPPLLSSPSAGVPVEGMVSPPGPSTDSLSLFFCYSLYVGDFFYLDCKKQELPVRNCASFHQQAVCSLLAEVVGVLQ